MSPSRGTSGAANAVRIGLLAAAAAGPGRPRGDRGDGHRDRHGPALALLGAFALAMTLSAARGARPAMTALAICGLATLAIATLNDVPDLDDTGQVGERYANASAAPGPGYYLETLGGALVLLAGGSLLLSRAPEQDRARASP